MLLTVTTRCIACVILASFLQSQVIGFSTTIPDCTRKTTVELRMDESSHEGEQPRLVLGDEAHSELSKLKSKYPTAEADYLAAARARSAAKMQSTERQATDDELQQLAAEKRAQVGDIDEWEESAKEAGNLDSQILIPLNMESEDDEDPDEPKLMLF